MCGIFAIIGKGLKHTELQGFFSLKKRGPESTQIVSNNEFVFGFHRLKIHDLSNNGNQPLELDNLLLICNGEIYNYEKLAEKYNFKLHSDSDCEIILHLYKKFGIKKCIEELDGVFAFVLKDGETYYAARDPIGVRPMFYSFDDKAKYFSSEVKGLENLDAKIFPPGHYWSSKNGFSNYFELQDKFVDNTDLFKILLVDAVKKRLSGDRKIGYLLSGGLDSSLIASIGNKLSKKQITTFSIGYNGKSSDLQNAKIMSDYLESKHHEVKFSLQDGLNAIPHVIQAIESYDITTVRASVPHYLISQYVKQNTDIKIVMSGEGSDEILGGYLYFHYAPSNNEFQKETVRLIKDMHMYDVLRSDRSISTHGLEARVPFLDKKFVKYVVSLLPKFKTPKNGIEKYLLRKKFEDILPKEICWRRKDGFSDSVGNWKSDLVSFMEKMYSDEEFEARKQRYKFNPPKTKEALYYRELFEKYYPEKEKLIPYMWMPKWINMTDPSGADLPIFKKEMKTSFKN